MVGMKAINPGDILQAMENRLIAAGVVATADPIYWIKDGDEPIAKPSGKRDILFCVSRKVVNDLSQIGGGRMGFRFELFVEVRLRTIQVLDRVNTSKDMLVEHWGIEDTIIDALLRFFPTDTGDNTGNAMTIQGLMLDSTIPPHPDRTTPKWGESIGTWRVHYLPKLAATPYG